MKCLVTKLKESVDNESLLKLGEMALKFSALNANVKFAMLKETNLRIIGDAYFTDAENENLGKTLDLAGGENTNIIIAGNQCELRISNKYSMITLDYAGKNAEANLSDFANNYSQKYIILTGSTAVTGDLSNLKQLTSLVGVSLSSTAVTGDLSNLKQLTSLTNLALSSTAVTGDLSNLKQLTSLTNLSLSSTAVTGDLSNLKQLTSLLECRLQYCDVVGDISLLGDKLKFLTMTGVKNTISWKNERPETANIIALEDIDLGEDVDKMLINQAKCKATFLGDDAWYHRIKVTGTRTSASDEAVQTLKNKGYTVVVNNVRL